MIPAAITRTAVSALVVVTCVYLLMPSAVVVPMAFSAGDTLSFPPAGFSWRWFQSYFTDPAWQSATLHSAIVGVLAAALATALGTAAALGLVSGQVVAAPLARTLFLLPMIVPSIVTAVAIFHLFSALGLTNSLLGLAIAHALLGLPLVVINVSAVLRKADPRIENAARSLGATPWRTFRWVTLPMIAPGIAAGAVFAFITSFDEVVIAIFLTGIDSATLPVQMWSGIRFEINPTVAAVSTILLAISAAALGLFALFRKPAP